MGGSCNSIEIDEWKLILWVFPFLLLYTLSKQNEKKIKANGFFIVIHLLQILVKIELICT